MAGDFLNDIEPCLKVLKEGGIILCPTDTVWGLSCDATNASAVEKIIELKRRPVNKSFVVLVASEKEVLQYTAAPDLTVFDYLKTIHKPVSVIYKDALGLAENVLAEDYSVAIRICKDEFCSHLIKRFRKPIVSTSANMSGEKTPQLFSQISDLIKAGVDYVVQYRQAENDPRQASAVIRWENGNPVFIRG